MDKNEDTVKMLMRDIDCNAGNIISLNFMGDKKINDVNDLLDWHWTVIKTYFADQDKYKDFFANEENKQCIDKFLWGEDNAKAFAANTLNKIEIADKNKIKVKNIVDYITFRTQCENIIFYFDQEKVNQNTAFFKLILAIYHFSTITSDTPISDKFFIALLNHFFSKDDAKDVVFVFNLVNCFICSDLDSTYQYLYDLFNMWKVTNLSYENGEWIFDSEKSKEKKNSSIKPDKNKSEIKTKSWKKIFCLTMTAIFSVSTILFAVNLIVFFLTIVGFIAILAFAISAVVLLLFFVTSIKCNAINRPKCFGGKKSFLDIYSKCNEMPPLTDDSMKSEIDID